MNNFCGFLFAHEQHSSFRQESTFKGKKQILFLLEFTPIEKPGCKAQSVGHLTRKSGSWIRYPVWQHTFVSPSAFSRRAVVSYWRKYVYEGLVNRLGGLSLPRKSVVRLTDGPDMTLDVSVDVKQQCNNNLLRREAK